MNTSLKQASPASFFDKSKLSFIYPEDLAISFKKSHLFTKKTLTKKRCSLNPKHEI